MTTNANRTWWSRLDWHRRVKQENGARARRMKAPEIRDAFVAAISLMMVSDDPSLFDALAVATTALARLDGDAAQDDQVRQMAHTLYHSPQVAIREEIIDAVRWSGVELSALGEPTIRPSKERVKHLCAHLPKLDPRLQLDEPTAQKLVRLFGRSNGARALAANWAWCSGFEGEPRDGESLSDDAPPRVVERYADPVKKKSKTRNARRSKVR